MKTHIMVDLETWGTAPGCDIRSIGAVVFDPVAGTLGDEFYVNVLNPTFADGVSSAPKYPLTRDPSTIEWWSQQSEAAQRRLTTDVVDLKFGLARFADWWWQVEQPTGERSCTFWAHGPHFDEAILAACYRATGLTVPWHYQAPRDTRTIYEAAGGVDLPFEGVEHDALADAKHQARCVIEAYRRIRGTFTVDKAAHDRRVTELIAANNREVERRREMAALLRECAQTFRSYEANHRAKMSADGNTKAERNAAIAARIDQVLA